MSRIPCPSCGAEIEEHDAEELKTSDAGPEPELRDSRSVRCPECGAEITYFELPIDLSHPKAVGE